MSANTGNTGMDGMDVMAGRNEDSRIHDWGVVHRILGEDGNETRILKLRLRDVPEAKGRQEIKLALERAGRVFGEGSVPWGNHVILPRDQWQDQDNSPAETLTFTDLIDEARGEKRVTLRMPIGLHTRLVTAAQGQSFNQFVTDTLARAIDYTDEPLEPALPRLAARKGVSVDEMREQIASMSTAESSRSEFARRFGEHLTRIAGLPAEQLQARQEAFVASPQWEEALQTLERVKSGEDVFADISDREIEEFGARFGWTPEQVREQLKGATAKLPEYDMADALTQFQEQTPQDTKDTTLMLRDIFTGRAAA